MKNDGTQTTQTSVIEALEVAIDKLSELPFHRPDIVVSQKVYDDIVNSYSSGTDTTNIKVSPKAAYSDPLGIKFYSDGQGYFSRCKYCKETGLEFKNKHIAYCPHCRAMFRYKGE